MTIHYTKGEEWANTLSHGVGILIGIAGGGYLLLTAMKSGNPWATGGMWLYPVSYTHLTLPTTPYV